MCLVVLRPTVPTVFAIATVSTARAVVTVSTARTVAQFWKMEKNVRTLMLIPAYSIAILEKLRNYDENCKMINFTYRILQNPQNENL